MKEIGAGLLVRTIKGINEGSLHDTPQAEFGTGEEIPHAPKIFTETARINWEQPVQKIHDLVRGLSPFPGAFTYLEGKLLKIFKTEKESSSQATNPGTLETDGKSYLKIAGTDGFVKIKELQLEGKKKMGVEDFLRGNKVSQN